MGLDDREQRILAEIERRFYEEDPELADAVRNITRRVTSPWRQRLLGVAVVASLVLTATYLWSVWSGLAGFVALVVSGYFFLKTLRETGGRARPAVDGDEPGRTSRFKRPG